LPRETEWFACVATKSARWMFKRFFCCKNVLLFSEGNCWVYHLTMETKPCKCLTLLSETDKLSSQLGKYQSFFIQLGIGLFNWVSLCL